MAASWWKKAEDEWVICKKHLASDAWMEVRYEELVTNPTNTLTAICSFIGVAYSTRMLDYIQGSTYEAPDKNLSFQWRTRMTKENIQLLESRIGDRLISRGYELSKHPKIALSFWTKIYLKCQSRFRMITFRFERFGILLTIVEILSRKLGVKKIHNIAIKKGSEIQDNYLK